MKRRLGGAGVGSPFGRRHFLPPRPFVFKSPSPPLRIILHSFLHPGNRSKPSPFSQLWISTVFISQTVVFKTDLDATGLLTTSAGGNRSAGVIEARFPRSAYVQKQRTSSLLTIQK